MQGEILGQSDLSFLNILILLVSTHIACERLSVMQDLAWAWRNFGSFCQ